jgi:hypothetical protein
LDVQLAGHDPVKHASSLPCLMVLVAVGAAQFFEQLGLWLQLL